MPFYTEKYHIKGFRHRGIMVDVYQRVKGAKHCGIEHEPDKHQTCNNCGEPLAHRDVFGLAINGSELPALDLKSEKEAIALGIRYVDHILEEQDRAGFPPPDEDDLFDDEFEDEDEDDLIDEDPEDEDDLPQPPSNSNKPFGNLGGTDMGYIALQMKKLGWFERAMAIVKNRKNKPPKKK